MDASKPPRRLKPITSAPPATRRFRTVFALDAKGVCALCRSGLLWFDRASSFGFYEGTLRSLIHLFKYSGHAAAGRQTLSKLLRARAAD